MTDTSPESAAYLGTGPQWNDTGQVQEPEPVVVHIASSNARPVRDAAPEYGDCMTWPVDTFANMGRPLMILNRRYRRNKARIYIGNLGGPVLASSEQSLQFEGSANAPAANGNVVNVGGAAIPPGLYQVQWTVELDGTPSATDVDNFKLVINGVLILTSTNDGVVGRYPQPTIIEVVNLNGGASVKAVSASTAGSVYSAQIVFTPVVAPNGSIVFNSRLEPLMANIPIGYVVTNPPYELEWNSQRPCYAVLSPGSTGPVNISVLDQAYEET